jgi:hypothetical protein
VNGSEMEKAQNRVRVLGFDWVNRQNNICMNLRSTSEMCRSGRANRKSPTA